MNIDKHMLKLKVSLDLGPAPAQQKRRSIIAQLEELLLNSKS